MVIENILVAPTAFKGTLSPLSVGQAINTGIEEAGKNQQKTLTSTLLPLADGGDGTIESIHFLKGGNLHEVVVQNAIGKNVTAQWLELENTAVIELASACGIGMLHENEIDPLLASTYGLGQVINNCLESNPESIVIAIGGSASTDGGAGALAALGAKFFNKNNQEINSYGGGSLSELTKIDLSAINLSKTKIKIACDVNNPLLGTTGAAHIFSPQKGANKQEVEILDNALTNFANILELETKQSKRNTKGAGAAGGTAFGLACVLNAEIISGFDWLKDLLNLEHYIETCDLIISGEGHFDSTSLDGKIIGKLAHICKQHAKSLWIIAACFDPSIDYKKLGITKTIWPGSCKEYLITQDISEAVLNQLMKSRLE